MSENEEVSRFSCPDPVGVGSLLGSADRIDSSFSFTFSGDLCQMAAQKRFLTSQRFEIGQMGVYPAVRTQAEFDRAITAIWRNKVEGWHHYRERLIELKVCTAQEYSDALDRAIDNPIPR